jgi:hypothetical protein
MDVVHFVYFVWMLVCSKFFMYKVEWWTYLDVYIIVLPMSVSLEFLVIYD